MGKQQKSSILEIKQPVTTGVILARQIGYECRVLLRSGTYAYAMGPSLNLGFTMLQFENSVALIAYPNYNIIKAYDSVFRLWRDIVHTDTEIAIAKKAGLI